MSFLLVRIFLNSLTDVDELKTRLIDEWAQPQFDQLIVDAAISSAVTRITWNGK